MMNMFAKGFDSVLAKLRNVAEKVPATGRKTMHRGADKIVLIAKDMCPFDTGALEGSIHQELQYENHGRLAIDIVCGGMVEGVDVDQYAMRIHENYNEMNPGYGTILKQQRVDVKVGGKFLTRAVDSQKDRLSRDIIEAVITAAKSEMKQ